MTRPAAHTTRRSEVPEVIACGIPPLRSQVSAVRARSRRTCFCTRPTTFFGSSETNSMYRGTANDGMHSTQWSINSLGATASSGRRTTQILTSSSPRGLATACAAHSSTAGCASTVVDLDDRCSRRVADGFFFRSTKLRLPSRRTVRGRRCGPSWQTAPSSPLSAVCPRHHVRLPRAHGDLTHRTTATSSSSSSTRRTSYKGPGCGGARDPGSVTSWQAITFLVSRTRRPRAAVALSTAPCSPGVGAAIHEGWAGPCPRDQGAGPEHMSIARREKMVATSSRQRGRTRSRKGACRDARTPGDQRPEHDALLPVTWKADGRVHAHGGHACAGPSAAQVSM